ncbi:MAG: hypothetical protein AAF901_05455 [Bacteroidota bacterium]
MAPIKFEENIKEKLEQRTLSPSTGAWSKLADLLDNEDKKRKNPMFWWLGIAASVAVMVFITSLVFNTDTIQPKLIPEVVEDNVETEILEPKSKNSIEASKEEIADTNVVEELNEEIVTPDEDDATHSKEPIKNNLRTTNRDKGISLAEVDQEKPKGIIENTTANATALNEKSFEENQVIKVVEEINKIKSQNNNSVSDRQIDSLLKIAHKELLKERIIREGSNVVDADALLQDVEEDLGQSFRSKVFEALKEGYDSVKTAVAERNN